MTQNKDNTLGVDSDFMKRYRKVASTSISRRLLWHTMLSGKSFRGQVRLRHKLTLYTLMCEGVYVEWLGW